MTPSPLGFTQGSLNFEGSDSRSSRVTGMAASLRSGPTAEPMSPPSSNPSSTSWAMNRGVPEFTTYLASPNSQVQAAAVENMPVLLSFAIYSNWMDKYQATFSRILIDSGAYSVMNSGKSIDLQAYKDFCDRFYGRADACAGLDDIEGDWRQSLKNYEVCGFPTFHDTDPPELLDDLIPIARERGGWIGVGLKPPRQGKRDWVRATLDRIPPDLHVHGWALRLYRDEPRLDSVDSTNWWRDGFAVRKLNLCAHLTYAEALEVVVKRYQRERRIIRD